MMESWFSYQSKSVSLFLRVIGTWCQPVTRKKYLETPKTGSYVLFPWILSYTREILQVNSVSQISTHGVQKWFDVKRRSVLVSMGCNSSSIMPTQSNGKGPAGECVVRCQGTPQLIVNVNYMLRSVGTAFYLCPVPLDEMFWAQVALSAWDRR